MEALLQDLRYGFRMLAKNPGFTVVAVLALAIGIGANSAIFSVINAVLLRPLPYGEPDRIVRLWEKRSQVPKGRVSPADFRDWQDQNQVFEQIAAYQAGDHSLTGVGEPELLQGAAVSANLFTALRVDAKLGRVFLPDEEKPNANPVAIISAGLWQRRFGADPGLIGKTIEIDNRSYTVVGVMPNDFFFPTKSVELWLPLQINPNSPMAGRGMHILETVGRLKPGISLARAKSEMDAIGWRLEQQYPRDNTGHGVNVLSLQEDTTGGFRSSLFVISIAVGFVLLIACANVANLLLARAAARQKEMSLRRALGAGRGRIIRQLLTESILLSLCGGALGLILAYWGIKLLVTFSPPNIPRIGESGLNGPVLAFTFFVALFTGVVFGLAPAFQISRIDISESLKEGGRGASGGLSGSRLRGVFVVIEVALSLILLIGSGLMIKSFIRIQNVNPGFNVTNILTARLTMSGSKYRPGQRAVFLQQVLERIQRLPGIQAAGGVTYLPLAGNGPSFNFDIEGRPPAPPGEEYKALTRAATPDYFRALGIPVQAGRTFTEHDSTSAPNVVIINDVMARRYWPNESPVGRQISFDKGQDGKPTWWQIVGVVESVRQSNLEFEPEPQLFLPFYQFSFGFITIAARTSADPLTMVGDVRRAVSEVDKDQPISSLVTMEQLLSDTVAPRRFNMLLLSMFAAVALFLAAIGIYGVISYSVTQRTNEIGIRIALGAQPTDVLRLVVVRGMGLALVGIGIGLLAAFGATRLLSSLLYKVSSTDPIVFSAIAILLMLVAFLASYLPAHRATRIDPIIALRVE